MQAEYETLSKNARKQLRIVAAIQFSLLFTVGAVCLFYFLYPAYTLAAIVSCAALGVLCLVGMLVVPRLRFRRYRYIIASDRIEIIEGILFVSRTIVPIDRIHQINMARGPLDTLTGVAKVTVVTAGSSATLRFLQPQRAEQIALYLNETVQKKLQIRQAAQEGTQDV